MLEFCTECDVLTSDLGRATTQDLMFPPAKGSTSPNVLLLFGCILGKIIVFGVFLGRKH